MFSNKLISGKKIITKINRKTSLPDPMP